jgi:hypothetical protein
MTQFGSQLQESQIEAVQRFVANPDQLAERYRLTFQVDEVLANLTTIDDIVLSLYFAVESFRTHENVQSND